MATEVELKLSLPTSAHNSLRHQSLLRKYQREEVVTRTLYNLYFDTPELSLNSHKIALRIRRQGERFIQTLKTRGSSQGGLHQRQEWEWDLEKAELDCSLLPSDALPEGLDITKLKPVFSTDFERTVWQLRIPGERQDTDIELVLDNGWAIAGALNSNTLDSYKRHPDRSSSASASTSSPLDSSASASKRDAISEVELELLSGDPEQLFRLALELSKDLPLRITRVSKAERGFRLTHPERARMQPQLADLDCSNLTEHQLLMHLLAFTQSAIESFEFLHEPALLSKVLAGLENLQALSVTPLLSISEQEKHAISEQEKRAVPEQEKRAIPEQAQQALTSCCESLRLLLGPWLLEQQFGLNTLPAAEHPARIKEIEQILCSQRLAESLLQLSFAAYSAGVEADA